MSRRRSLAILLLVSVAAVVFRIEAKNAAVTLKNSPLDLKILQYQIKDSTLVDAVSELSRQPIDGLHLGVEEVLRDHASDSPQPGPQFSISLNNATVRQVLEELCVHDARYTWQVDGETINIYPKAIADQDAYLLNRKLDHLTVTDIPDPGQALSFLDRQLPPPREQLGEAGSGGDSAYPAPWTHSFTDITVRQLMNRLSEHMGSHTSWLFYGSKQERFFTFVKGGFH